MKVTVNMFTVSYFRLQTYHLERTEYAISFKIDVLYSYYSHIMSYLIKF